eukprot:CAMPEP_0174285814 /NCGR_PEP_ID=MMETSP0809-20121228/9737_1 /TAXON_ID=73025 ORGANISM="Eutreptiella gymnastica-like, Strain CCMP1594" /NCGR_SAMPLE_ID=MMETSP0809 /ASSEMBLY_ACC=CAM_ASM_000658 /LENGTH=113 /DNA_ID=CAMNT_0015381685 /DNA_START=707 /DNA_END=1048 /DNA_ORIENTATION=-
MVEKVGIQQGLDDASNPGYPITLAFNKISVNPIQDVKETVAPKSKQVVARQHFGTPSPLQQEQLGQNGCSLQPLAEGPQHFNQVEPVAVEDQSKDSTRHDEVPDTEGVVFSVI